MGKPNLMQEAASPSHLPLWALDASFQLPTPPASLPSPFQAAQAAEPSGEACAAQSVLFLSTSPCKCVHHRKALHLEGLPVFRDDGPRDRTAQGWSSRLRRASQKACRVQLRTASLHPSLQPSHWVVLDGSNNALRVFAFPLDPLWKAEGGGTCSYRQGTSVARR